MNTKNVKSAIAIIFASLAMVVGLGAESFAQDAKTVASAAPQGDAFCYCCLHDSQFRCIQMCCN